MASATGGWRTGGWQGQLDQGEKTDLGRGPVVAFSIIIITMYLELLDHCAFF